MLDICSNELLINQLKCNQCSKILSEPPVYYSSSKDNLCGRCFDPTNSSIKNGSMQQAVIYEAVAQFLLFPCSNHEHGCKTKLNWKEAVQHEKKCEFAVFPCPFNLEFENTSIKCDWIGIRKNLNQHLKDNHKNDLQLDLMSSPLDVNITYCKMFFTVIDNLIFLVITKLVKMLNKFYCTVICCEDSTDHPLFRYQLELGHDNDCKDLTLNKPETERFSSIQEIITNDEKMIIVDIAALQALVQNLKKSIYYKISIIKNPKFKNEDSQESDSEISESDSEISESESSASSECSQLNVEKQFNQKNVNVDKYLNEIECPVCNEYMVPPIFLCATGHSICNSCKSKMQICPICRCTIQGARNFTLEKLTSTFNYPCKHHSLGCNVYLHLIELESHQRLCSYGFEICPWKTLERCNDENVIDIINHFHERHSDLVLNADIVYKYPMNTQCFIRVKIDDNDNQLFILCFESGENLKFNVIHFVSRRMNKTKSKYKYKLEFDSQTDNNLELTVSHLCQKNHLVNPSSAFKECLSIPQKMVEPFMDKSPEPYVCFKLNILKM